MRRYRNVDKDQIFDSWNKLRNALLAAKDGIEVNLIMNALFTEEEKFQLGRRISISQCLKQGMTTREICELYHVGVNTVLSVTRKLEKFEQGFELIEERQKKVELEYGKKKYKKVGGSKLVFKKKIYTGITRKDIQR